MHLVVQIGHNPLVVSLSAAGMRSRIRGIKVRAMDTVSAVASLEPGETGGKYVLRAGNDSIVAVAVLGPGDQNIPFKAKDTGERFRLFKESMGATLLLLADEDHGCIHTLAQADVELDPDDRRPFRYDRMVEELLEGGLPHYVVEDFEWQMLRNRFSFGWGDGYASRENDHVMLEAMQRTVGEMCPCLRSICVAPRSGIERIQIRRPLAKIKSPDARTRRNIARAMAMGGGMDLDGCSVLAVCKKTTLGVAAHSVLRTFLEDFVLRRCEIVEAHFREALRDLKAHPGGDGITRRMKHWDGGMSQDLIGQGGLVRDIRRVRQLEEAVRGLLRLPVFEEARERLTIFDVDAGEFMHTEAYSRLYRLMRDFLRARFWWEGDNEPAWWTIPRLRLDKNGETRLQRKYSIVYENWCFARLAAAFAELGYAVREVAPFALCEGACLAFAKDGVEVVVQHGVYAKKFGRKRRPRNDEFECTAQRPESTPDFAAIVTKNGCPNFAWFVGDAKSDGAVTERMARKRCEYADELQFRGETPFASVLFVSGENTGEHPGIDFPPPPLAPVPEAEEEGEKPFFDHSSDDYRWVTGQGVVEGPANLFKLHGHLRANVVSVQAEPGIFREFVEGMVATACRRIDEDAAGGLEV